MTRHLTIYTYTISIYSQFNIQRQYTYLKSLRSSKQSKQRLYLSRVEKIDHRYIVVESNFVSRRFRNRLRVTSESVAVIARRTFVATLMNTFCWSLFAVERCWSFESLQRIHFERSLVTILLYVFRVIVTFVVYSRLFELHRFDIQSTEQKSHCVNITFWSSQCYVLIRQSDFSCSYQF